MAEEQMGGTFRQIGDHLIPNLALPEETVLLELAVRKGFCNGSGNFSLIPQNLCIIDLQKSVQFGGPICHGHGNMPSGLPGGVVQIHGGDFVQFLHLIHG